MKILILVVIIFSSINIFCNEDYYWQIFTTDERIIKVKTINIESGSMILFIDDYDLERIIKVTDISLITRINLLKDKTDCIYLKDKTKIIGDISDYVPAQYITINTKENRKLIVEISKIERLGLVERTLIKGDFLKYYEFGTTLGYPSAVNLNFSYFYSNFGIGVSGLFIYVADGIQFNASFCFENTIIYRHGISLISGISNIRKDKINSIELQNFHWEYVGLSYNFNYGGFYSELGLTIGSGNYSNPNFVFQVGYVHRFLK